MNKNSVSLSRDGHLAIITIERPEVLNALDPDGYRQLEHAVAELDEDRDIRVLILTGAGGRAFCVGSDLRTDAATLDGTIVTEGAPPPTRRTPMIAAIDGWCLGGGLEWALQADFRIATTRARFGLPEPRTGSLAGFGLHALSRMIPPGEALYLQLTGLHIDAERALRCCLVQEVVEPEQLLPRCRELAAAILACSPAAVSAIKQTVDHHLRRDLDASYAFARPLAAAVGGGWDAAEGRQAFLEKREPKWTGA